MSSSEICGQREQEGEHEEGIRETPGWAKFSDAVCLAGDWRMDLEKWKLSVV